MVLVSTVIVALDCERDDDDAVGLSGLSGGIGQLRIIGRWGKRLLVHLDAAMRTDPSDGR